MGLSIGDGDMANADSELLEAWEQYSSIVNSMIQHYPNAEELFDDELNEHECIMKHAQHALMEEYAELEEKVRDTENMDELVESTIEAVEDICTEHCPIDAVRGYHKSYAPSISTCQATQYNGKCGLAKIRVQIEAYSD